MMRRVLAYSMVGVLQWAWPAQATTHDLNLTGVVSSAVVTSGSNPGIFGGPPTQFTNWTLTLGGLDDGNSFQANVGDSINVFVQLDQGFLFPAQADSVQSFGLNLTGAPALIEFHSATSGAFLASYAGTPVASYGTAGCSSGGSVGAPVALCGGALFNGAAPIQFDTVQFQLQVVSETNPVTLNSANLVLSVITPVPESPAWLLMIAGAAGVFGAAMKRRRA